MRNPNKQNLALRDPAFAAIMGALPGADYGTAFGSEDEEFGVDFGFGADMGFGDDYGAEGAVAVAPPHHALARRGAPAHPAANPAHMQAAWHKHSVQMQHTAMRKALLDPNEHSTTKVERYSFSIPTALVLNTASVINTTLQPNTKIRPERVIMNAPVSNFVLVTSLLVANVNVFVGGTDDAVNYNNQAQGVMMSLPTLDTSTRATITGNYTGLVPPGYAIGFVFQFILTLQGWATIAGNG